MDDLTRCLYEFVQERRMGSVYQDAEYTEMRLNVDQQTEKVQESLSKEQRREVSRLLDSMTAQANIESEHLFQATLRLARELGSVI